jgi:hypothetical protein
MFGHHRVLLDERLSLIPSELESFGCETCTRERRLLRSIRVTWVKVVIREKDVVKSLDVVCECVPSVLLGKGEDTPKVCG